MIIGKFYKAPADRKRYTVNYDDWLDEGELLTDVTVFATVNTDGFFVDGADREDGARGIIFYVSGGTTGMTHTVTITIYTDRQQIKEDTIVFMVNPEGRNP